MLPNVLRRLTPIAKSRFCASTPRAQVELTWFACGLTLLSLAVGCGEKRERRQAAGSPDGVTDTAPAETQMDPPPTNPDAYPDPAPMDAPPVADSDDSPKLERPQDVAQWTIEHYQSAKLEKDQTLDAAIKYLDENRRDEEFAVQVFLNLLTVEDAPQAAGGPQMEPDTGYGRGGRGDEPNRGRDLGGREYGQGAGGYGGGYGGSYGSNADPGKNQVSPEQAENIVAALGRNTSDAGRKLLRQLVVGRIQTPLNRQALFAVSLDAMLENPHVEHDTAVLKLVTETEKVLPSDGADEVGGFRGGGSLAAEQVRRDVMRRVGESGSIELRRRFAEYLDSPDVMVELGDELERLLAQDDPRNLPAQIVMFKSPHTSEQTLTSLYQRLTQGSRGAFAYLLGMDAEAPGFNSYRPSSGYGEGPSGYGEGPGRGRGPRGLDGYERSPVRELLPGVLGNRFEGLDDSVLSGRGDAELPPVNWYGQRRGGRGGRGAYGASDQEDAVDPVEVYKSLATLLWTDAVAEQIAAKLIAAENLSNLREQAKMLASMPGETARKLVYKVFEEHQDDGPRQFATVGFLGSEAINPAFLLVAKTAYHGKESRRRNPGAASRRGGRGVGFEPGYGGGNEEDQWVNEVESFIQLMAERMSKAESTWSVSESAEKESDGQATDESADSDDSAAADESDTAASDAAEEADASGETGEDSSPGPREAMDVRLHRGAQESITAEYHLRWPEDATARIPGVKVAPLEVHYLRIEQETTPQKLTTFYRRAAGSGSKTHTSSGQIWYDGLTKSRTTGDVRSVDVIIRNADASGSGLRPTEEREMVIEIFIVSEPDFTAAQ